MAGNYVVTITVSIARERLAADTALIEQMLRRAFPEATYVRVHPDVRDLQQSDRPADT